MYIITTFEEYLRASYKLQNPIVATIVNLQHLIKFEMKTFKAFRTEEINQYFVNTIQEIDKSTLESGEVIIEVAYSGINYKDYLSSRGNKGVTRNYPHTPGVDVSGRIVSDKTNSFHPGDEVIVMGYDLGMNSDGGFAEYISVPASWVLRKPERFSLQQTMQIGTSGFTAALGIKKMLQSGLKPADGAIVVSGATGGVGIWAVQMLSKLGFEVWAVTGKTEVIPMLESLGAKQILNRDEIMAPIEKPLLRPRWAGAFDTVGGETLSSLLKQTSKSGSVATCGNVGGIALSITVLPFILNGINLLGINAADTLMSVREEVWALLEEIAEPLQVSKFGKEITLEQIGDALDQVGKSGHIGRFTIKVK